MKKIRLIFSSMIATSSIFSLVACGSVDNDSPFDFFIIPKEVTTKVAKRAELVQLVENSDIYSIFAFVKDTKEGKSAIFPFEQSKFAEIVDIDEAPSLGGDDVLVLKLKSVKGNYKRSYRIKLKVEDQIPVNLR